MQLHFGPVGFLCSSYKPETECRYLTNWKLWFGGELDLHSCSQMLSTLAFSLVIAYLWGTVTCGSSVLSESGPYTWNKRDNYYFTSLEDKIKQISFQNACTNSFKRQPNNTINMPISGDDVNIAEFPVSAELFNWWRDIPKPKQMRVDPYICDVVYTKRLPIFNNTGCQLPGYMSPSAPRCQTKYLRWICEQSRFPIDDTSTNHFTIPEADHKNNAAYPPPQPWLLTAKNAIVSMCGQISLPCGVVHTNANCKATAFQPQADAFRKYCPRSSLPNTTLPSSDTVTTTKCAKQAPFDNVIYHHKRVFVVAEVDDTYVYHTHLEIMPRIVYHLDFLKQNPDIKIMFGCDAKKGKAATEQGLRSGLQAIKPMMELVGLSMDRLVVHKHVYAEEVYLPMEGGCQDPVYNTWQILHMRKLFMQSLGLVDAAPKGRKPVMLLLKRSSGSKHTRNGHDLVRQWNDEFTESLLSHLQTTFPSYNVVLYSDRNDTMMRCYGCQIRAFAEADVLIGVHGAGLGNMIYMKPNSAVVELAPYGNDGRCLLGGGPFSRAAAVLAHNYMMHQPPYEEFKWITKDSTSEFDITRFVTHVYSFLKSIEFV